MPRDRISTGAVAAATTLGAITVDVKDMDALTVMAILTPASGVPAQADVALFVRVQNRDGSDSALLPPVRTIGDSPGGTRAGLVAQYDVRGLDRVLISPRNNNATIAATSLLVDYWGE